MKVRVGDLRKTIREEFLRGVPEFVIRQATDDCVARVMQHIKKFIQLRAENPTHARELLAVANSTMDELDEEMFSLVQDKLWQFVQQT